MEIDDMSIESIKKYLKRRKKEGEKITVDGVEIDPNCKLVNSNWDRTETKDELKEYLFDKNSYYFMVTHKGKDFYYNLLEDGNIIIRIVDEGLLD